jgi:hypothetical protein
MEEPNIDLDPILKNWPYDPSTLSVRLVNVNDDREVIQMRVEMGLLQLDLDNRPDGTRPEGADTYLDYLLQLEITRGNDDTLTEEQCAECDREFVQFYHRRICWLALQRYDDAVRDADHSLGLMDLCQRRSPDEQWTLSHEQYRPFVMYHRIQAMALALLETDAPEDAIQAINRGLDELKRVFLENEVEDLYEDDELVARLVELRETLRTQFDVGRTLHERLAEAIAEEQYELAARLRDQLSNQSRKRR